MFFLIYFLNKSDIRPSSSVELEKRTTRTGVTSAAGRG